MSLKLFRWLHQRGFSRKKMQGGRLHSWLGDHLFNKDLWRFKKEPVARAWLLGCLVCSSPLMGVHILLSCVLAIPLKANLPVTFALQWLTNPFTAPVYYPAAFILGCKLLRFSPEGIRGWRETLHHVTHLNFDALGPEIGEIGRILAALFVGCFLIGLVVGVTGYTAILLFWPDVKKTEGGRL